jgi:hypothetical protein
MRGPWSIETSGEDILDADDCIVATAHPSCSHLDGITTDHQPGNARLIAAAPDLLDVVLALVRAAQEGFDPALIVDENSPIMDAAREAIAKATGAQT